MEERNRPFTSFKNPYFQAEDGYKPFLVIMTFYCFIIILPYIQNIQIKFLKK